MLSRPQFRGLKAVDPPFFSFFPFLLLPLLSEVGELPSSFSGILEGEGTGELVAEQWSGVVERGGGGRAVVKAYLGSVLRLPMDACRWCSVYVFSLFLWFASEERWHCCPSSPLLVAFGLSRHQTKATCNLSCSGGDRLAVAFTSALQFLFPIVEEDDSCPDEERDGSIRRVLNLKATPCVSLSGCDRIHAAFCLLVAAGFSSPSGFGVVGCGRRHPSRRDLVATCWLSPSCSEGDAPVVAFRLPVFLALVVVPVWPTALLGVSERGIEPVEGVLRATSVLELATVLADSRAEGKTVVGSGVDSLTSWRVRSLGWFCLWALDLVEVRGSRAGGETSVSRGCSVSLVVTPGCPFLTSWRVSAKGCFRIVFDSAGSAGVVSSPTLVVGHGITLFRYFFLLLWMVRDWLSLLSLVREAHPPYSFQVASFPAGFKCELQESVAAIAGCTCYERGCWFARATVEFVVSLYVHVGMLVCCVARLVERFYTCLWLLSSLCWLVVNSGELLLEFFSVGSGGSEGLRSAVRLAGAFWRVFPKRCLSGSGGGSPRTYLRVLGVHFGLPLCCLYGLKCVVWLGCVLVRFSQDGSWRFWWRFSTELPYVVLVVVFLFVFEFLGCAGGTSCVPVVGWFASLLAPYVLSQMVVWKRPMACLLPLFSVGCSGWWCSTMAFGAVLRTVATFVAKLCFGGFGAGVAYSALLGLRFLTFVHRFTSLLGVRGVELSASGTLLAGTCLVAVPLPLRGGCFALSRQPYRWIHVTFYLLVATGFSSPSGFGVIGCGSEGGTLVVATWWRQRLSPFSWDPHPREPVEGVLQATSVFELEAVLADSRAVGKTVLVRSHCLSRRWFRSHVVVSSVWPQLGQAAVVRVCVLYGGSLASLYRGGCRQESAAGELEVWMWHQRVCGSLTSWHVRGPGWFCLWALDLVEVRDSGLTWLLRCSVGLLSRWVCAEGCFHIVFDSAGSAEVMSGPTLVVGHGITLFRCFVVLCSRDWLSLLSLVHEAHPPTLFRSESRVAFLQVLGVFRSVGSGATFEVLGGGREVGSLQRPLQMSQFID
ncbi:hypothetical protein Taro_032605, partial [Colocasia esculenta]|nr:hypothetical protein [Colocasia esculenta]